MLIKYSFKNQSSSINSVIEQSHFYLSSIFDKNIEMLTFKCYLLKSGPKFTSQNILTSSLKSAFKKVYGDVQEPFTSIQSKGLREYRKAEWSVAFNGAASHKEALGLRSHLLVKLSGSASMPLSYRWKKLVSHSKAEAIKPSKQHLHDSYRPIYDSLLYLLFCNRSSLKMPLYYCLYFYKQYS